MFRYRTILTAVSIFFIVVSACSLSSAPVLTGGTQAPAVPIDTQVAQIVADTQAAQTVLANAVASTLAAAATDTPEFTFTPGFTNTPKPTNKPKSTNTPKPTNKPKSTNTPKTPTVTVSVNTNCRSGPNTNYDLLGIMMVGEKADVVGRSTLADTMIIKLPSNTAITCWLWAQNATVVGDMSGLPVIPIPPTPTPKFTATAQTSFNVAYISTQNCLGLYRFKFQISNTGVTTWESDRVIVTDQNTSITKTVTRDNFPYYSAACTISADQNLEKGEVGFTTSEGFAIDPAGHNIVATIRVCSLDGLTGTCQEKTITFTP